MAEVFEKEHKHVLRDIDTLLSSTGPDLGQCSFFRSVITETQGGNGATLRTRSFDMTRDGMTLLVMGFTGAEAGRENEVLRSTRRGHTLGSQGGLKF